MKTIEMAREAGIFVANNVSMVTIVKDQLERFADLIRADERERIKKVNAPEIEKVNAHIKSFEAAVADEREACAKVCETKGAIKYAGLTIGEQCAAAIRTRSDK